MKYLIIIERTGTGFSAYSPDVPGCVATGQTENETKENIADAIVFHLEGLELSGACLPTNLSKADYVEIAAYQ